MKLITIITATLNAKADLVKTHWSISQSTYKAIQWVVIDGGSNDGTIDFLKKIHFCSWVSEADEGIYDAWNKGINLAKGEWIIFLGAGDLIDKNWINYALKSYESENGSYNLIYGNQNLINTDLKFVGKIYSLPWDKTLKKLRLRMSLNHTGILHHKSLFKKRLFNKNFKIVADWLFFIESSNLRGLFLKDLFMSNKLIGGISNSYNNCFMHYLEYRILVDSNFVEESFLQEILWRTKTSLAKIPSVYIYIQKLWRKF